MRYKIIMKHVTENDPDDRYPLELPIVEAKNGIVALRKASRYMDRWLRAVNSHRRSKLPPLTGVVIK